MRIEEKQRDAETFIYGFLSEKQKSVMEKNRHSSTAMIK